jgi:hypothetical protein
MYSPKRGTILCPLAVDEKLIPYFAEKHAKHGPIQHSRALSTNFSEHVSRLRMIGMLFEEFKQDRTGFVGRAFQRVDAS